jgi:cysteine desulfurase
VLFHVDAVQTVGHLPVDVSAIGCDLLSLSAHKFYGPVGAGALYVRGGVARNARLAPLFHGGFQEEGLRAGTLNTPAVVALGAAARAATPEVMTARASRVAALRERLVEGLCTALPDARLQGPRRGGLPGVATFVFPGVEGEAAVIALDLRGIHVSSGPACTTGLVDPSHVLLAIGRTAEEARSAVRFSLGAGNTAAQVDRVVEVTREVIRRLERRGPARASE